LTTSTSESPDLEELLCALPAIEERLAISMELASPSDFISELPGWRDRSPLLFNEGSVSIHHFDPYSQALSKIESDSHTTWPTCAR
jgi:hypothetical protein